MSQLVYLNFNAKGTSGINIFNQLQVLFEEYKLSNKLICYLKDEGTNMFIKTNVFKQIVNCKKLEILAPFEGVCVTMPFFKHANMPPSMKR
jgi:hypothetical protein